MYSIYMQRRLVEAFEADLIINKHVVMSYKPVGLAPWQIPWMSICQYTDGHRIPDSKVHGAIMGPIWDRQDPGGTHDGPMNFVIWDDNNSVSELTRKTRTSSKKFIGPEYSWILIFFSPDDSWLKTRKREKQKHKCWPSSMSPKGVTRPQWVN